jgi:hypothetical protein
VVRWTIGLDLIVAILAIVGGVTVLFTHYAGGGPDLRPYGFADIDGVPMAMAFVLGWVNAFCLFLGRFPSERSGLLMMN